MAMWRCRQYASVEAALPLFEGSNMSVGQYSCGLLGIFEKHKGVHSALDDAAAFVARKVLPEGNRAPRTFFKLQSMLGSVPCKVR